MPFCFFTTELLVWGACEPSNNNNADGGAGRFAASGWLISRLLVNHKLAILQLDAAPKAKISSLMRLQNNALKFIYVFGLTLCFYDNDSNLQS